MQPSYKRFPALHLNIFVQNVFYNINFPEIQDNYFISLFQSHEKECLFKKMLVGY